MQKIAWYIVMLLLPVLLTTSAWTQTNQTLYSIGFIGGQKKISGDNRYNFSSAHVGSTGYNVIPPDDIYVTTGLPFNVLYFQNTFDKPLFASKGYYADYVQLQWNVVRLESFIKKFKIYRKEAGNPGDSLLVASLSADNYSWKDEYAERGIVYEYTLFAEGLSDKLRLPYVNILRGVGFSFPTGRVSGRITFEGGTAVEGVTVMAETEGNLSGKSLYLNGSDAWLTVPHLLDDKELEIRNGFTLQAWCKPEGTNPGVIFSKGANYQLSMESNELSFRVGDATAVLPFIPPVDTFFHVSAVYNPTGDLALYVHVNEERVDSVKVSAGAQPAAALDNILFGRNSGGNFFHGSVDEVRLWSKSLPYSAIKNTFSRYINGTETGLVGYWRMNEGVGSQFYDFSRKGFTFYENHAQIRNGAWSLSTPTRSQLAFKGVTDASGNYTISGFPYETDGSIYKFTPVFGTHSFDPGQQIRLVSNGSSIINELNFKDISAFQVTGTVRYRNTGFPVEGVSVLVDGKPSINGDGQTIVTDNFGRFSVSVPIGKHSIRLAMQGHTFEGEGRFPVPTATVPIPLYDFQRPVSGIEFLDVTLVKVAGRVAGGPVEESKLLGFGKSKNNLGNAVINLTTEKGFDISLRDSTKQYSEEHMTTSANFNTKNVKIYPDAATGEFVAYLPPEKYKVTGVTAGAYIFDANANVTVSLKEMIGQTEVLQDTVGGTVDGIAVQFPPYDPADYDTVLTSIQGNKTWKIAVDTFHYQQKQYFIYRTQPTLLVTNKSGGELFGSEQFVYEDKVRNIHETIPLTRNGAYTFGHPVFNTLQEYTMNVSLFEEYTNSQTGVVSKVPVTDGVLEIVNNLATNPSKVTLNLNANGKVAYTFSGGLPDINTDNGNPENSYTKTLNITALSGNKGSIRTIWRQNDPFRGFVLGSMPTANTFVTTGPTDIITILRDPPGSGSSAYLESGKTTQRILRRTVENAVSEESSFKYKFGAEVKTFAGAPGVGVITEIEYNHDVTVGFEAEEKWVRDGEQVSSITTTKKWATSDDAAFVGDKGDVFVGSSSLIQYGIAAFIDIIPVTDCSACIPGAYSGSAGSFSIGLTNGLYLSPHKTTTFMHTQGHIEDQIIPNLKRLRDSFLEASVDTAVIQPKDVSNPSDKVCSNNAIYVSLIPTDDARFGTSNSDTLVWGSLAVPVKNNPRKGPSYVMITAKGCDKFHNKDTVEYFNNAIKDWVWWLEKNEEQKHLASKNPGENIAFDAGAVYESSIAIDTTSTFIKTFGWTLHPSVALTLGHSTNKFGVEWTGKVAYSQAEADGEGNSLGESTTYGYTLADGESTDYYSVNVSKPGDGYGPIFRTNGGVTSCPHEGATETRYYKENGKAVTLNPATVAVDAPVIEVEQSIVSDVASNRPADFNLLLKNNSGIGEDRWYTLRVDDTTNPHGAVVEMDGAPVANGRTLLVKAGETLQKTLRVRMGRPDVMNYEDIRLTFASACDDVEDDAVISVFFIPGCSDITLETPVQNWVMNTNNVPRDSLLVKLTNYNLDHDNFKNILFQYKPSGGSLWTTDMVFYNPNHVTQEEYDAAQQPKQWISGPSILYYWDMHSQPDRNYDLRAKTGCELGPATLIETPTDVVSGIKDVKRPVLFGSAQPADGVVSVGEEISIEFDETIEASLLTPFNFSVQAVLNGYPLDHNTSVEFDGANDQVTMSDGLNLMQSFTIEFWIKRSEINRRQVVLSKGIERNDVIEAGFTAANQLFVKIGGQEIVTSKVFSETDWYHYAIVFDANAKKVSAYRNDEFILENVSVTSIFSGTGSFSIGQSLFDPIDAFGGNIHELRVWTKALPFGDIYARMNHSLSGNEIYLAGYWPFDEANGALAHDKARHRHGTVNAIWRVLPGGKSYAFDGVDDYVELNTAGSVVISDEMDFTVEFWFKGSSGQQNVTLFSSGKGDGTDFSNAGSLSIGFNNTGKLQLAGNGIFVTADDSPGLLDDNWHHVAASVSRKGNANIFVDGELIKSQTAMGIGPLYGVSMWLGARGYKMGTLTTLFDQYFNGIIDEFRIWTLSKKQEQVLLASNAKLSGDEPGLVAYYPFEYYTSSAGAKTITPTLADQSVSSSGPNGGTAQAIGGADYSDLAPNIKDTRPLQKVDFTWAVNDNKIIITPSPSMSAAIEKTLLEITVSRVEDKYENRIASPVSWTAFIDRNQMKWSDDLITLEKTLYQPLVFTADIINQGGTQQSFVINNLPNWLKADPSSGTLQALSSVTIKFTVDEGLNTGAFQEDIYLKADFGYDEKLTFNLRNYAPIPADWKVDPDKYPYSMNINGQIKVNGRLSNNPYDYVAAFVGEECRGVAHLQYIEAFDNYQLFLTVYGTSVGGENLTFRIWNANEAQVYANVKPEFVFTSNAVHGTPSSPIIFESMGNLRENTVELPKGWKWISFNLYSDDMKVVNNIVAIQGKEGDQIKGKMYYDTYNVSQGWVGSLTDNGGLRNEEMYKVYVSDARKFRYTGTFPDLLPVPVMPGWNWIGYVATANLSVNEALASLSASAGDLVKGQHAFAIYEPAMGWIGNLTYMKAGEGYMYKAKASGTLVYPKASSLSNGREKEEEATLKAWKIDAHAYSENMNVIAEVVGNDRVSVEAGDQLGAFVDGVCVGIAIPTQNALTKTHNFFITIQGDATTGPISFRYYKASEGKEYSVRETIQFMGNGLHGTARVPVSLTLSDDESDAVSLYPNPFRKNIDIDLRLAQDSRLLLEVIDITGKTIRQWEEAQPSGVVHMVWDGKDGEGNFVQPGVYILRVSINGVSSNYRIIKY